MWGHGLSRMPAERAREAFGQFLATAVGEYKFSSSSLVILESSGSLNARFERMLGLPGRDDGYGFDSLTEQQSDQCLEEIIKDEAAAPGETRPFRLSQAFSISKWRSGRRHIATDSLISMNYGRMPSITTFLEFDTFELFQHIKRVLAEVRLCNLNERHLKGMRAAKK
jgi:hypothetical protein